MKKIIITPLTVFCLCVITTATFATDIIPRADKMVFNLPIETVRLEIYLGELVKGSKEEKSHFGGRSGSVNITAGGILPHMVIKKSDKGYEVTMDDYSPSKTYLINCLDKEGNITYQGYIGFNKEKAATTVDKPTEVLIP